MKSTRVIVFNTDESFGPDLRRILQQFPSVHIVAEVDDAALLAHVVGQFAADVLILHLDPVPESILPIAGELVPAHPELAIFAVSESTDGQLILSAMRRGITEFITKPIDNGMLADALAKTSGKSDNEAVSGKLLAVMGTAGGVGTTSVTTNLAVELMSMCSGGVAVVDLDYRFGQVATCLDVAPTYTIADLAQNHEELEQQVIDRALVAHSSGVRVLSRPTHFVQCENITAANCVNILSKLQSLYEYVVVDGPSRYDPGASAVLDLADMTLLVTQLTVPSIRNAQRILQGMDEAGFNLERTRLIVNRMSKDSGPLGVSDVEGTLNKPIFATVPDDAPTMSNAINLGETLAERGPKTRIRAAIRDIAAFIHDPDGAAVVKDPSRKGGLLTKIFSEK